MKIAKRTKKMRFRDTRYDTKEKRSTGFLSFGSMFRNFSICFIANLFFDIWQYGDIDMSRAAIFFMVSFLLTVFVHLSVDALWRHSGLMRCSIGDLVCKLTTRR